MFDRLNRFRRDIDGAAGDHRAPRADVIEDKDTYLFYVDMPGLKDGSIDMQVEDDRLMVAAKCKRPRLAAGARNQSLAAPYFCAWRAPVWIDCR